uniref:Uncharacterized protein n=1 Tax=Rhizophora mucronata TaxID=61149 RepID=A0A2P2QS77_RHIMU
MNQELNGPWLGYSAMHSLTSSMPFTTIAAQLSFYNPPPMTNDAASVSLEVD